MATEVAPLDGIAGTDTPDTPSARPSTRWWALAALAFAMLTVGLDTTVLTRRPAHLNDGYRNGLGAAAKAPVSDNASAGLAAAHSLGDTKLLHRADRVRARHEHHAVDLRRLPGPGRHPSAPTPSQRFEPGPVDAPPISV